MRNVPTWILWALIILCLFDATMLVSPGLRGILIIVAAALYLCGKELLRRHDKAVRIQGTIDQLKAGAGIRVRRLEHT